MSGIYSGILQNAYPLSADRIKELEIEVLENGSAFAYIDEVGKLCFALPDQVDIIKELAWDNAYELYTDQGTLFKKAFTKTGLYTYEETGLFSKTAYMDSWQDANAEPEVDPATYLTVASTVDGRVSVKAAPGADIPTTVMIPETLNGYPVYQVHSAAFLDNTAVQKVIISDSVEYVQSRAFNGCSNLTDISLGTGLFFLAAAALGNCKNLTNVTYRGTTSAWQSINKNSAWHSGSAFEYVQCTNGRVYLDGTVTLEGDGQTYHVLAPTTMSFRSAAPLDEFQEVLINGDTVDPVNYELEEGSTIVKLSTEYLKTLPVGEYNIEVVSKNAAPSGTFTVIAPDLNEYGFYYNQPYGAYVPALSDGETIVFIREQGVLDYIIFDSDGWYNILQASYVAADNKITITDSNGMTLNVNFSADGKLATVAELDAAFVLGASNVAADQEYLYIYDKELDGYKVKCIDNTKEYYDAIKTGINGIATVALDDEAFKGNVNLKELNR